MLYVNALSIIILFLSAYSYFINAGEFWYIASLALGLPIILLINILFIFFWLAIKRMYLKYSLISIILCLPVALKYFPFNKESQFSYSKNVNTIRVLTWNVGLMNLLAKDTTEAIIKNLEILDAIKNSNADIVCLQEFLTSKVPDGHYNFMDSISRTMGYKYRFFSNDNGVKEDFFFSGSIIFSKYELSDFEKITYPGDFAGSVIAATITKNNNKFKVITSRLQSPGFKQNEYRVLNNLKRADPDAIKGSKSLVRKLKNGYQNRNEQIRIVQKIISESNYPVIFTADLNDVPNSYAYRCIKGNLQDAWLKKGSGLGRTFSRISPTLRIDYIFSDKKFNVLQSTRIINSGSDHYAVVTDLQPN